MFSAIQRLLQLDRSLLLVIQARVWHAISGPVTIALVISAMTLPQQGIYYGLIGIVGIQAFFELGLLNVLVSQVGHEVAQTPESKRTQIDGTAFAHLSELVAASRRWFFRASLLFAVSSLAFGVITFWEEPSTDWLMILVPLVVLSAVSVWLSPAVAILEGAGYREDVYRYRFYQVICGSLAVWLGLMLGFGIWVLPISTAIQVIWVAWLVYRHRSDFFAQFNQAADTPTDFSWSRDVVPIQWRAAVISLVCHVATQLFVVIIIKFHSSQAAAPLGMTLSVTTAIQMLAMAWVQTKYPLISSLHGADKREQAGVLWRQVALVSTGLLGVAMAVFIVMIWQLGRLESLVGKPLTNRFLSPSQVSLLAVGCIVNHLISLQGAYVFSRRLTPLAGATVIGYGSIAISVWVCGYLYAVDGLIWAYVSTMLLVAFPVHTFAYLRVRFR